MRYRKKFYRNSTKVIKMKFQSFMDISTDTDSMKIITISAGGKNLLQRCPALFSAYKYWKMGNISAKLVPASTLPVDPTGLAYGVEQKVDPRDQLSPGLMRITNGEDIFEDISGLSDAAQEGIYKAMMLDPRWYKWMLQRGVKRHATPRYWQIGQLHQDKWPGAHVNLPAMYYNDGEWVQVGTEHKAEFVSDPPASDPVLTTPIIEGSSPYGIFQTGHSGTLGWLPTDGLSMIGEGLQVPQIVSPPEVEVMKCILPKAYKTRYYYRLYISETVYFKEPVVSMTYNAYRPLDVFQVQRKGVPITPSYNWVGIDYNDYETGGNYGDD